MTPYIQQSASVRLPPQTVFKYAVRIYHIFNPLDGVSLPKKKSPEIFPLDDGEQKNYNNI
ncbi:MAG: hypothetical protein V3G42_11490 [Oscillospiraceae bacterium]